MKRRNQFKTRNDCGAALIEFALILPLFLTILSGVMQIGMAITQIHDLSDAMRHGARAGSVDCSVSRAYDAAVASFNRTVPPPSNQWVILTPTIIASGMPLNVNLIKIRAEVDAGEECIMCILNIFSSFLPDVEEVFLC